MSRSFRQQAGLAMAAERPFFADVPHPVLDELVASGHMIKAGPKLYIVKPAHDEKLAASQIFTSTAAQALKETLEAIMTDDPETADATAARWATAYCGEWPAANDTAPVCECGVKFTGGIHSGWCPCAENDNGS